jgi:hypothetical protein
VGGAGCFSPCGGGSAMAEDDAAPEPSWETSVALLKVDTGGAFADVTAAQLELLGAGLGGACYCVAEPTGSNTQLNKGARHAHTAGRKQSIAFALPQHSDLPRTI